MQRIKRIVLEVGNELHHQVKKEASFRNVPMKTFIAQLIVAELQKVKKERK